ncbi:sigma factor-like helix-turn-helix DNA-binding protein [Streptomyces sp. NPDC002793]|uniref:sigma factor-like helix-turn-helix DNA-binding protein n=1 Tax=Streptomyces sp. NPDC002793 TaxID=3154432 RepID=UPI003324C260
MRRPGCPAEPYFWLDRHEPQTGDITLAKTKSELAIRLDRNPTGAEPAWYLDIGEEEVIDGLVASNGYTAGSVDMPAAGTDQSGSTSKETRTCADLVRDLDPHMELVEDLHALVPLLKSLDERAQAIVRMRFGREMTRAQIGEHLGLSRMHVLRLITRTRRSRGPGSSPRTDTRPRPGPAPTARQTGAVGPAGDTGADQPVSEPARCAAFAVIRHECCQVAGRS